MWKNLGLLYLMGALLGCSTLPSLHPLPALTNSTNGLTITESNGNAKQQTLTAASFAMAAPAPLVAFAAAPISTNPPVGRTFSFAWDASPSAGVAGYALYSTSNRLAGGPWMVRKYSTTTTATVTNVFMPQWFFVTAVNASGDESPSSNIIGWTNNETVIEVTGESTEDLQNWTEYAVVYKGTNVPGMKFFRTKAAVTTRAVWE